MPSRQHPGGRPVTESREPVPYAALKRCGTVASEASHTGGSPPGGPHPGRASLPRGIRVGGSDAPEKREVRVGFLPLTDCASLVMTSVLGFDKKHGIELMLTREPSWATIRDKLLSGQIDAAQLLHGLVYGVQMGIGGPRRDLAVLMTLSQNGQGITFARHLKDQGITSGIPCASTATSPRGATPSPTPSRPARTRCGSTTGWRLRCGAQPAEDGGGHRLPRLCRRPVGHHRGPSHGRVRQRHRPALARCPFHAFPP